MNVTQLIKRVRRSAFLEAGSIDWTDANIVEEMNDVMTEMYARAVIEADQGHWQVTEYLALVAGQRSYRLPARAVMGTTMRTQITTSTVDWYPLEDVSEADALRYEYDSSSDQPLRKIIRGENMWMLPPAASAGSVLRTHYMISPSRICCVAQPTAGIITNINPTTRVVTVGVAFQSVDEAGALTAYTGTQNVDIIRVGGWHKVQWTGSASISGTNITLSADASGLAEANDLSDIAVGDVVRAAEQTDWPAIPAGFHRSLADATATKILTLRGMDDASNALAQKHVVPNLQRFGDLLRPRDGSSAFVLSPPEFS